MEEKNVSRARGRQKDIDPEKILLAIEKIDAAIQITSDVTVVLDNVIHEVIQIFQSDRAWLFYPCNPNLSSFEVAFESTTPSYPGAKALKETVPMTEDMAGYCLQALAKIGEPVVDPSDGRVISNDIADRFNVKSLMFMALQPQLGDPWMFGLHQCDHDRIWTDHHKKLFKIIGHRITNCIGNMLHVKQLAESEKRYRSIVDTVKEGVILQSASGEILTWNKGAQEIFGMSSEETIGKTSEGEDWPLIHEDGSRYDGKDHPSMRTLRTGEPCRNELMGVYQPSGELRWISVNTNPLFKTDLVKPYAVAISFSDITEFKRVEDALRKSEENYRLLVQNQNELVVKFDNRQNLVFVSPNYCRTFGVTKEEILGKEFFPLVHEEDIESVKASIASLKTPPHTSYHEERAKTVDGRRWFGWSLKALVDESGNIEEIISVGRDISQRKQTEFELKKSRAFFQAALDNSQAGIAIAGVPEGELIYVNRAGLLIRGGDETQLVRNIDINKYVSSWRILYFDGSEYKPEEVPLARAVLHGHTVKEEFMIRRDNEEDRYVLAHAAPIHDEKGERIAAIVVFLDITDRKKAEKVHEKLQEQLLQVQKMESVGRLAGGVAHDFNNKLSVILGHMEMVFMDMKPDDPLVNPLREVQNAAKGSADLTRQLLAFARKQTISPKTLDLNETLEGMLTLLRRLIGEDIELSWHPETDLWPVMMDPSQIDQILANLCVNARDAIAGVGGIRIRTGNMILDPMYCEKNEGFVPGEYVMITVGDNGCGMDKNMVNQIFEPFFTTKGVGKGTGLGLSTVYGIVKQNNGFINVYSEPGKGTVFKIYIPRHETESTHKDTVHAEKLRKGSGETILLVEDDRNVLNLTRKMIEKLGYQVISANDPKKAIQIAHDFSHKIHLLMTDVVMPQISGNDLAKQLSGVRPDMRVLFMSGYTADVISSQGILEDGINFIEKPISMNDLGHRIREILEGKGG